jgi:hypothetical protein
MLALVRSSYRFVTSLHNLICLFQDTIKSHYSFSLSALPLYSYNASALSTSKIALNLTALPQCLHFLHLPHCTLMTRFGTNHSRTSIQTLW